MGQLPKKIHHSQLGLARFIPNLIVLALFASAVIILGWVGWLTWYDLAEWNKDIGSIFFGARTGEGLSLGIGMRIIYYFVIGIVLLASALFLFLRKRITLRKRIETTKPRHFTSIQPQRANEKEGMEADFTVKSLERSENEEAPKESLTKGGCPYHFGYLASRPKDSPVPQECFVCRRLGDCMVASIHVENAEEG